MHVTLLLTDHCSAASASIALEMLTAANLFAAGDTPPFEVVSASLDGADVTSLGGQRLQVDAALAELEHTELVLIPGFLFTLKDALPSFAGYAPWLRQQQAQQTQQ